MFKPYILENTLPDQGYFTLQPCLRTRNIAMLQCNSVLPVWSSLFTSCGSVAPIERLNASSTALFDWFVNQTGFHRDRLIARVSEKDVDLSQAMEQAGFGLEIGKCTTEYYQHVYGHSRLSGRNCNLAVVRESSNTIRDIGNIIVIELDGEPVAVETAFGLETVVSAMMELPNSIAASSISDFLMPKHSKQFKAADAVAAALEIIASGVKPFSSNQGRLLRAYLHAIIANSAYNTDELFDLQSYVNARDQASALPKFIQYLTTLEDLVESTGDVSKANSMFHKKCVQLGIV